MRVEFMLDGDNLDPVLVERDLDKIAAGFSASAELYDKAKRLRMGICVSKPDHCLADLLYLWNSGELRAQIPFVVSNYAGHKKLVDQYDIPFYYIAATKDCRKENELLSLVKDQADFLVLARYMLFFSKEFLASYGKDIINIHHGFLPSFKGKDPYRQALAEGVKVIGATAHFVTEKLDEGPIISQAVNEVSHKDDYSALVRKGRDLEKSALSEAVSAYLDYRVIKFNNKTIVF